MASIEAMEAQWIVAVVEHYHNYCRKWRPQELMHHILDNKARFHLVLLRCFFL